MKSPDLQSPPEYADPSRNQLALPHAEDAPRSSALETSPAWELELLISAAIVVGLFALPGIIDRFFARLEPHATAAAAAPVAMLHIYLLSAGYALLIAFVVHFSARAYWVGLIGLNSVFPRGLRWDRLSTGPAVMHVYRTRLAEPRRRIERVDNFCSITFSFAFMIVMVLVFTIVLMSAAGALAWAVARLFFGGEHVSDIVLAIVVGYLVITMGTVVTDKRIGSRLAEGSLARRFLNRMATLVFYITPTVITGPILLTLTSNFGRRRMITTFQLAVIAVLMVAAADRLKATGRLGVNSYEYVAVNSARSVDYRHYEDERLAGDRYTGIASIQSQAVSGPYVNLFIPYTPSEDNAAVAALCPSVSPLQRDGVYLQRAPAPRDDAVAAALNCLGALHPVTLDGELLHPDFDFYENPSTGLRGILAHLPTASLAPGRHVIAVAALPVTGDPAAAAPPRQFIPFWR